MSTTTNGGLDDPMSGEPARRDGPGIPRQKDASGQQEQETKGRNDRMRNDRLFVGFKWNTASCTRGNRRRIARRERLGEVQRKGTRV
jgi:hypothetical protein